MKRKIIGNLIWSESMLYHKRRANSRKILLSLWSSSKITWVCIFHIQYLTKWLGLSFEKMGESGKLISRYGKFQGHLLQLFDQKFHAFYQKCKSKTSLYFWTEPLNQCPKNWGSSKLIKQFLMTHWIAVYKQKITRFTTNYMNFKK